MTASASTAVSVIVLVAFGTLTTIVVLHAVPEGSQQVANILLGSLATMAGGIVNYWTGSSSGSARKTELLAQQAEGDSNQRTLATPEGQLEKR